MEVGPFKYGEPFDERTPDGRECTSTITLEGEDTWVHSQVNKKEGGKDVVAVRRFHEGGIDAKVTCEGVTAEYTFVRTSE